MSGQRSDWRQRLHVNPSRMEQEIATRLQDDQIPSNGRDSYDNGGLYLPIEGGVAWLLVSEVKMEGLPLTVDTKVVLVGNVFEAEDEWDVVLLGYCNPCLHSWRGLPVRIVKPQACTSKPCVDVNSRGDPRQFDGR